MKILRTAALFLAAALFCSGSCESMPELKTQYPAADLDGSPHLQDTPPGGGAELSREEETGPPREDLIPEDESSREDLVSDGEPSQEELPSEPEPDASGPRIAEGPSEKAAVNLPEEEPEQGEAADSGLSEPEFEFAQSDYPPQPPAESGSTEAEALPAPEPALAEGTEPPRTPEPARPQQGPPPAQQPQPPVQPPPQRPQPQRPQQAQQTPPQEARQQAQEQRIPPEPPDFLRPFEAVQETPPLSQAEPVPVPGMPFRPPAVSDRDISYSRTVKALTGQYIEIPFRGPGWVYLGELGSRRGVYYDSRRIEDEGVRFIFRADEAGTYSLKFNRQDFIRDIILNDYVQVVVEQAPQITGSAWAAAETVPGRVYAAIGPDSADGARSPADAGQTATAAAEPPPAGTAAQSPPTGTAVTEDVQNVPGPQGELSAGTPRLSENVVPPGGTGRTGPADIPPEDAAFTPADHLSRARAEYDAGHIAGALGLLDQFKKQFPGGSDEAWWLYGQALEANGPNRDIRLALDYYRRLVKEYPQSARYDDARRRIAYLERFYFNIQ